MRAVRGEKRVEWRIECSWMDFVLGSAVWVVGGETRRSCGVVSGRVDGLGGAGDPDDGEGDGDGVDSIGPGDEGEDIFISSSIEGSGMVAYRGRVWGGRDEKLVVLVVVRVFDVINDCL